MFCAFARDIPNLGCGAAALGYPVLSLGFSRSPLTAGSSIRLCFFAFVTPPLGWRYFEILNKQA
jgi:hypothetical protein